MKVVHVARALLVFLVTLLALAPRAARPVSADGMPRSQVASGSHYVLVNPAKDGADCAQRPMALCPHRAGGSGQAARQVLVGPARLPATATAAVVPAPCPDQGAVCGTLAVPLDRAHPAMGTIPIFFELFTHTSPGPAQSAILVNPGGPGAGTVASSGWILSFFGQDLDAHDLLLIDDRGRGYSGTINCSALQHGTEPFAQAEADCAAQLGQAASRYGTGDIAQDTEAVRAALGYDKVDFIGFSAGGQDVAAYATRFGAHLRSILMDAPYGPPGLDPFFFEQTRTLADLRMVRLVCTYSPTCGADHPDPQPVLDALVRSIQAHPIEGDAYDVNGNLVHVRIDETVLLSIIHNATGAFTSTGELVAAAASLLQGDPAPLLRLAAEGFNPSLVNDYGDPTGFSIGAHYATACVDAAQPWNWAAVVPGRQAQYDHAVQQLPTDYFAPFSRVAPTGLLYGSFGAQCLWWQKPTPSSPVTPPNPTYPNVPTLVLNGDIDNQVPLEEATRVAQLYPGSTLVPVAYDWHTTMFHSNCAANLGAQFIETMQVGDTICTRAPEMVFQAVGRFPNAASAAAPAAVDPNGNNQVGTADRHAVTVGVAAGIDALQRTILNLFNGNGSGNGRCLRAGSFHTDFDVPVPNAWTTTLTNCSFSQDVAVSGTLAWGADNSISADLALSGSGTSGGTIHVSGFWLVPGPVGNFTVTGQLGGLNVGLLVPEA